MSNFHVSLLAWFGASLAVAACDDAAERSDGQADTASDDTASSDTSRADTTVTDTGTTETGSSDTGVADTSDTSDGDATVASDVSDTGDVGDVGPGDPCPNAHPAQRFRGLAGPVEPQPGTPGTFILEAEEFRGGCDAWAARDWGTNYYASTFANTFLSRRGYLGAAPDAPADVAAHLELDVHEAGSYLALVRYEAPYHFEARFRLRITQGGVVKLDRLYGARDNTKIWAFGEQLATEIAWPWGADENMVWEGHDATVQLDPGPATLELLTAPQPEPAGRRNVDAILLTTDQDQVHERIQLDGYLPLDGWLTQAGDLYLKVTNKAADTLALTVPPGVEHSSYWVHRRTWTPLALTLEAGQDSGWLEVGGLLDTLNSGQWLIHTTDGATPNYTADFAVRDPDGGYRAVASFDVVQPELRLAYDADSRYTLGQPLTPLGPTTIGKGLRPMDAILYDLVNFLETTPQAGHPPQTTPVYAYAFDPHPEDATYTAAHDAFLDQMGLTETYIDSKRPDGGAAGAVDVRDHTPEELEAICQQYEADGTADGIRLVSLGDEIGLQWPPEGSDPAFHQWLASIGLAPSDVVPTAGVDWSQIHYDLDPALAASDPGIYFYSRRYQNQYGIDRQGELTKVLQAHLPQAEIGANYSPHPEPSFLGEVHKWVTLFRQGAMTLPWSEDYAWQIPIGTQQMTGICLDEFRAGLRGRPDHRILYYVMPHWPGNTLDGWRRQFYGDLLHGMKLVDLFEFRPLQVSYTENYTDLPAMYLAVRKGLYELAGFEDLIQPGHLRSAEVGLWFSETGDIWQDMAPPFGASKRTLYIAIRHQQLPLDVLVDADAAAGVLADYKVLYLVDRHVSRASSRAIADWVKSGGHLFATAGAGLLDELDQPNTTLTNLFGIAPGTLTIEAHPVHYEKQDLPFATPVDTVTWHHDGATDVIPALSVASHFTVLPADADPAGNVTGTFGDGSPAIAVRTVGAGTVTYVGFLPGLAYFQPAIPERPVDRGTNDSDMDHFIPTAFPASVAALVASVAGAVARPVTCSEPLVESGLVESPQGFVVPLINWSAGPVSGLHVTLASPLPTGAEVTLASGGSVTAEATDHGSVLTLDLAVADAIIVRMTHP